MPSGPPAGQASAGGICSSGRSPCIAPRNPLPGRAKLALATCELFHNLSWTLRGGPQSERGRVSATQTYDADVIVVGAGPGGSTAAYHLAQAGIDVLALEKARFPREKVCGDGLTPRAV